MGDKMKIIINIGKLIARFIYWIFKLLPIQDKIVFISRFTNETSIDFTLLINKIKEASPHTKIIVLNHKLSHKFFYLFSMLEEMYHLATAKVCIIDSYIISVSILNHKKGLKIFQLWHALGAIKKFGHQILDMKEGSSKQIANLMHMHKNYTYVLCGSDATKPFYIEAFNVDDHKLLTIPLPRVDYLLDDQQRLLNEELILNRYPKLRTKRNILYAPTFRKHGHLTIDNLIKDLDYDKYNLIIKKHPHDHTKLEANDHVIIDNDFNILQLLSIADYIITDYSAVAFEAAILDIPLFFYVYDIEEYQNNRGLNINLYKDFPKVTFKDANQLIKALNEDYDYRPLHNFKKKYVSILDGTVTDKIYNLLL